MNTLKTIAVSIISITILLIPVVIFGYLGLWLKKYFEAQYTIKFPQKSPNQIRRRAMLTILIGVITIALAIMAVIYALTKLSVSPKLITEAPKNLIMAPKIDMHEHFRAGGDINYYLGAMAKAKIEKMVLVPTDWPPSNPQYKENMAEILKIAKEYPDKFIPFATTWNKDPEAAEIIENAIKNGAKGIKFIDWLYSSKYSATDTGPVDSPNMYKVYEVARKYKVPILIHIDFQKKPEWRDQFWKVATDFPDVTFILAHYCRAASGDTPELKLCAETLDKFPNVYVDISMGGGFNRYTGYFDKNAKPFMIFISRYQDRILWGADIVLDGKLYKGEKKDADWVYKRMLADFLVFSSEKWQNPLHPDNLTRHNGFGLPESILRKIYWENPMKILIAR